MEKTASSSIGHLLAVNPDPGDNLVHLLGGSFAELVSNEGAEVDVRSLEL